VPKDAAALFITGRAFHTEAGDRWHLVIKDPQGWTFFDSETTLEKGYQFHYQYMGKKAPAGGFMPGLWTATLTATRGDASNSTKHTFRVE
jgi:hypothetical protein